MTARVYSVDGLIRLAWEKEIGYIIQCEHCIAYLKTLNYTRFNLDTELEFLMANLPTPDWWRMGKSRQEKLDRIRIVIEEAIESYESALPDTILWPDSDWVSVVTTAYRQECTLSETLMSMRAAGWNPFVFAEPNSTEVSGYRYIRNTERLGAWHNWLNAAKWAVNNTSAKYILVSQDDSLYHPDSRSFFENCTLPDSNVGFISLYTAAHYSQNDDLSMRPVGINTIQTTSLWGACALVFPRESLITLLDHPLVENWTGVPPKELSDADKAELLIAKQKDPSLIKNIDSAIGLIMNSLHLDMLCIDPSPVIHISEFSSIGHSDSNAGKRNCIRCSDHSKPLRPQVLEKM